MKLITLPLAMAVTVLLSSYVVRVQTMWRQAPISAAFVIAASLEYQSREHGLMAGATRMGEVLFGCLVGIVVAWVVSVAWPLPDLEPTESSAKK
jgi:acid phosphatase family membrane protein YuiD